MRTVKRVSQQLNTGKWAQLEALVAAYAQEKQWHLDYYLKGRNFTVAASDRLRRDQLVQEQYVSPFGLQARAWKLALKDAHETIVKWYAVLATAIRPRLSALQWTEQQKHYANWLLCNAPRLATLILARAPLNPAIKLTLIERKQVQSYLRRTFRKLRGHTPQVRTVRSLALDTDMYTVRTDAFRQVIEVAGLTPSKRIAIVLQGQTTLSGNLRLVLDREQQRVEIHTGFGLPEVPVLAGENAAVDAGLTEVFTDEEGKEYGTELGQILVQASAQLGEKGRRRNKLHAAKKKAIAQGDQAKAARLPAHNLGTKKQTKWKRKLQLTVSRVVNHALNQLVAKRQMAVLVTEALDLRGKAKSKRLARRVSLWHRSILNERTEFKASAKGFCRKQVNPAYSSQLCPLCGFLDHRNRAGDAFQCLNCGHAACSDRVAAVNLKMRLTDPEIARWTPPAQVKAILVARFHARLESRNAGAQVPLNATATVAGPTLDTKTTTPVQRRRRTAQAVRLGGPLQPLPLRPSKSETAGEKTASVKCDQM